MKPFFLVIFCMGLVAAIVFSLNSLLGPTDYCERVEWRIEKYSDTPIAELSAREATTLYDAYVVASGCRRRAAGAREGLKQYRGGVE